MDHCHYTGEYTGAACSKCSSKYSVPKETSIIFHNGSNYHHHSIKKKLPRETCLGENTEKYTICSVSIDKEVTRIDKNGKEIKKKTISYRLQFIDSARFMASSLSKIANNLAEGIHKIKY